MTKIKKAFHNIWKIKSMDNRFKEEDKKRYFDLFLDGYGCAIIDAEEKKRNDKK